MIPDFLAQALAPERWPAFVLVTARLGGLMLVAPLWSMSALPRAVRAAITVLLAVLLLPSTPKVALPEQFLELPLPLAVELAVGIVIGLTAAVIVQGVALAGETLSIQMGLSLGPVLAPMPDLEVSGVGQLKAILALLLYVSVGGHLVLLRGLAASLQVLPPGAALDLEGGARAAAQVFGTLFGCAVRAAAPVMVALLLANITLAMLSRAVPQLNAMMVSLPLTIALGLLLIGLSLPVVSAAVTGWLHELPARITDAVAAFRPVP